MRTRVRKLTDDEVRAMRADLVARMKSLQRGYETSEGIERDRHLLGALVLCNTLHRLPLWLYKALRDQQVARVEQQPNIHWKRWWMVTGAYEEGLREGRPRWSLRKAAKEISEATGCSFFTIWNSYKAVAAIIKNMKVGPK
jgi:hypothetical protein